MGKQVNFFADKTDKNFILQFINDIFVDPIIIPHNQNDKYKSFTTIEDSKTYQISEMSRKNDMFYQLHEYFDGEKAYLLNIHKSPVFEFSACFTRPEDAYASSRFYTDTEDTEFSKKVTKLFAKIKKICWYDTFKKKYITKTIDIENSLFHIPNSIVKIKKENIK
jgi:hypothetical protein